jgi:CPA2 family monovalent cation:H+ antiporter-2
MLVDVHDIAAHPALLAGAVAVVIVGKTLAAAAGPALIGYSARVSVLTGLTVAQIGEFAFVLATAGRALGLIQESLYQSFLTVAVLTILVTPFLLLFGPRAVDRVERLLPAAGRRPERDEPPAAAADSEISNHVIVVGYGLNGRNLSTAMRAAGVAHLIVDLNAQAVRAARAQGEPILYGDATREEILRLLGITRARMLVAAISDAAATRRVVRVARHLNPGLHIIARTRYVAEVAELGRLGADVVIPEEFETSVEIFNRVLAHYGVPRGEAERLTGEIRASHYQALRPGRRTRLTIATALGGVPQMTAERVRLDAGSPAVGRTLADTRLRTRTGALVLSISRGADDIPTPDPLLRLREGDVLTILGRPPQVESAIALLRGGERGAERQV